MKKIKQGPAEIVVQIAPGEHSGFNLAGEVLFHFVRPDEQVLTVPGEIVGGKAVCESKFWKSGVWRYYVEILQGERSFQTDWGELKVVK